MAILSEKIEGKVIEVKIQSSNIKSSKYNTEDKTLLIEFNNDSVYQYNEVPWEIFTKLRMAESQGKYFNSNISKKYKYEKIK
jgi:hypothetical protein